jgi:hypothetical protein
VIHPGHHLLSLCVLHTRIHAHMHIHTHSSHTVATNQPHIDHHATNKENVSAGDRQIGRERFVTVCVSSSARTAIAAISERAATTHNDGVARRILQCRSEQTCVQEGKPISEPPKKNDEHRLILFFGRCVKTNRSRDNRNAQ